MSIKFFVPGIPQPGGSKKAFMNPKTGRAVIVDDAKHNRPWRERVAACAADAYDGPPLAGPLMVAMRFVVTRPAGHYGSGRNADTLKSSAPDHPAVKPDVLKLARSTEDALKGIVWRDDSQTVRLVLEKQYGERPGAEIEIEALA
jgi:Holliday junction resolvase RusA-like endonuclease